MFLAVDGGAEAKSAAPENPISPAEPVLGAAPIPAKNRTLFIIIVVAVIVLIVALACFILIKVVLNKPAVVPADPALTLPAQPEAVTLPTAAEYDLADEPAEIVSEIDSDGDGLSNSEEEALGTNIAKIDTDGDGLFDRDEVELYKTDPLNSDTDGDSYLDGEEVMNGYNPKGAGKLLNFEAAVKKINEAQPK